MPVDDGGLRKALVLYGSETGNAQDAAEELGRLVRRLHFATVIDVLDVAELDDLHKYSILIIAISTTGQGDLPRNAQGFWKRLLRKKLPPSLLSDLPFGIYGLGDSSYPQFNYAALKLSKRLTQLGAVELLPIAAADDQHPEGSEATFVPWASNLRASLLERFPIITLDEIIPESVLLQPPWILVPTKELASTRPVCHEHRSHHQLQHITRLSVTLEANRRLTPSDHWQDVRQLEFASQSRLDYMPGDILEIQPKNPASEVSQILEMMDWHSMADVEVGFVANPNFSMAPITGPPALHPYKQVTAMTIRNILTECIDLNGIPKRSFFRLIAHFTEDNIQRSRLEEFADPELTDELFNYTTRPRRSIIEVLQEFNTVQIPWQWLFEVFPLLRPRQFSIASGGDLKADNYGFTRFELLVAIVKYRTVIRKLRRGTCTRYLEGLESGAVIEIAVVRGSLGISQKHAQVPLVMVGPGTGVAPLRALLWEKQLWERSRALKATTTKTSSESAILPSGINVLFFGCRNEASDFFFRDEWDRLRLEIPLDVLVAFSRDQEEKVYVQDLLRKHKCQIFDMLYHKEGFICVCGSSGKMPAAIRATLADIFEEQLGCSRAVAEAHLRAMEKVKRYKQETW